MKKIEWTTQEFESRVAVHPKTGCWWWIMGCRDRGYGLVTKNSGEVRAHRLAWRLFVGDIPDGVEVCHSCDVTRCCNPAHLFLGTHLDNMRDCWNKGRNSFYEKRHATHCLRGHLITGLRPCGKRYCKVCKASLQRDRVARLARMAHRE